MTSAYSTLSALYVAIQRMLDGDDPETSDLSVESLEQLLGVAQKRIYRGVDGSGGVRSRWNEKSFSGVTVTGNLATLPDDFIAPAIVHFGRWPLKSTSEAWIQDNWNATGGCEEYFAQAGNAFTFWPAIADGSSLQGRYYARLPDLTDDNMASNLLFQNADDLFIYGCLVESAPFFGETDQMPVWQSKYASIVDALNLETARAAHGVGRLRQRPSAKICGGSFGNRSA